MNGKLLLLVVATMSLALLLNPTGADISKQPDTRTVTADSETNCVGNVCTLNLYSYPKYVWEDDVWKDVTEAKSLMGSGWEIVYLEQDDNYKINVIDYNYTSIILDLSVSDKELNKDVPIKIYKPNESKIDLTGDFKKDYDLIKEDSIKLISKDSKTNNTYDFNIGDILEFGTNSTTIILDSSFIPADIWVSGNSPATAYGFAIRWNITSIPVGNTINNATLVLYMNSSSATADADANITRINNQTWIENVATDDTFKLPITNETTYNFNQTILGGVSRWEEIEVLTQLLEDYSQGNSFTSFRVEDLDNVVGGTFAETNDTNYYLCNVQFASFYSSSGTAGLRPQLRIEYTEGGGAMCSPTINIDWIITDAQTCSTDQDIGTGNIVINTGGTLTLISNADVTANSIQLNKAGDSVFINSGSELRVAA